MALLCAHAWPENVRYASLWLDLLNSVSMLPFPFFSSTSLFIAHTTIVTGLCLDWEFLSQCERDHLQIRFWIYLIGMWAESSYCVISRVPLKTVLDMWVPNHGCLDTKLMYGIIFHYLLPLHLVSVFCWFITAIRFQGKCILNGT